MKCDGKVFFSSWTVAVIVIVSFLVLVHNNSYDSVCRRVLYVHVYSLSQSVSHPSFVRSQATLLNEIKGDRHSVLSIITYVEQPPDQSG